MKNLNLWALAITTSGIGAACFSMSTAHLVVAIEDRHQTRWLTRQLLISVIEKFYKVLQGNSLFIVHNKTEKDTHEWR
jgi:hypothetical protein